MDYHYRQAIAKRSAQGAIASVEQADQLINQATSPDDFELGAVKAFLSSTTS